MTPALTDLETLPTTYEELDPAWQALLDPRHQNLWPALNDESRRRLLERLARAELKRSRERQARADRQRLSAEYVTALCNLPKRNDPNYDEAWQQFLEKKAAYMAVRKGGH